MNSKLKSATFWAVLFAVAMCSSQVARAAPPKPCLLLTQAQVGKTLGTAVVAGKPEGQFDCEWDQVGWTMVKGKRVLLQVLGPVGHLTPVQNFNIMKMPVPFNKNIVKTAASGIGDDAVYITGPGGESLTVKKGNSVFQVRVQGFPLNQVSQVKAKEKQLALDVLARL